MSGLSVALADRVGLAWAQQTVTARHYRHSPVDDRSRPLAYLVMRGMERVGVLMCNRPESTVCRPLYGSLTDLAAGLVTWSRWSVINLCRVWLDPRIQRDGDWYVPSAATWAIGHVRRRVVLDYLLMRPPVYLDEPYELRLMLSYNQPAHHQGTIYKAAGFTLARTNAEGLQTYTHSLRRLQPHEQRAVRQASERDNRGRRYRSMRATADVRQLALGGVW